MHLCRLTTNTRSLIALRISSILLILIGNCWPQSNAPKPPASPTASTATQVRNSRYQPDRFPKRAKLYYGVGWGIDELTVKRAESGELIRFNYRVLDPVRAQPLIDKKSDPYLVDERARVKLVVPSLEKVGQLRQTTTPEAGKVYWMAFSNKGGLVKRGDRVNVVIGKFHADGLVVQ